MDPAPNGVKSITIQQFISLNCVTELVKILNIRILRSISLLTSLMVIKAMNRHLFSLISTAIHSVEERSYFFLRLNYNMRVIIRETQKKN